MHYVRGQKGGPLSILMHPSFWFALVLFVVLVLLWRGLGFAEDVQNGRVPLTTTGALIPNVDERGESLGDSDSAVSKTLSITGVRAVTMTAIEGSAKELLPSIGEDDGIERFWFVSDAELYVEYKLEGGEVAERMAFIEIGDGGLARKALYGQGGSSAWELIEGSEVLFTKPQRDLYERAADGSWGQVN